MMLMRCLKLFGLNVRRPFFAFVIAWLISASPVQSAPLTTDPNDWVSVSVPTDPMMENLTIPADAAAKGMWSSVFDWPMNGLHNMVLPDGKVLTYGTSSNGLVQEGRLLDVWDPSLGFGTESHSTTFHDTQLDSFCTTTSFLTNGKLLITGGNSGVGGNYGKGSTIFDWQDHTTVNDTAYTALPRWYATMINLPDSRPLVLGGMVPYTEGMVDNPEAAVANGLPSMTPEVYENGQWRSLLGAYSREAFGPDFLRASFPHAFVAPNGQVFGISADNMWYLDPDANNNNGQITYLNQFKPGYTTENPVNVGALSVAVMYAPGKIIQVGGNGGWNGDGLPASNLATVVDINGPTPVLTEQPPMQYARRYGNGIVLASGDVVITGGTKSSNNGGGDAIYPVEIWHPETGTWDVGADAATIRVYHSITSLLTNGAVLSTGGGTPGPVLNLNGEVYYPPYLFESAGGGSQLATRPVISAISGIAYEHEANIQLDMADETTINDLVMIGLSNGTHTFNSGQRRIPLTFTQDGNRLSSQVPNANLTPPGYYQVVALNAAGVPSYGVVIAIGQNLTPPNIDTDPYTPPEVGGEIDVPVVGIGEQAVYSATAIQGFTYSWNFGDGSADTPYSGNPAVSHTFTSSGLYVVTLSARDPQGIISRKTWLQAVATSATANPAANSSPIIYEPTADRVWTVNPDNDSVSILSAIDNTVVQTVDVGVSPRTLALATGNVWVTNKRDSTISWIDRTNFSVTQNAVSLPRGAQPHGMVVSPDGAHVYIVLEALAQVVKLDATNGNQLAMVGVGPNPRHIAVTGDGSQLFVSRFITPPLPGESTATIDTSTQGGEVVVVDAATMSINQTVTLQHSDKTDNEIQGSGVPNYLAAAAISPDGSNAWVPSKQDNIKRGVARNGVNLDFQNTVRAISSKIDLTTFNEVYADRVDHDNSSMASAAVYHPSGIYLFVALETSREVVALDALSGAELFRVDVGRAPQGLAISDDGNKLFVHEFMDRSVQVIDLTPLTQKGQTLANSEAIAYTVQAEKLPANVVLGKQLFYDAKDSRLARDSYMSCASCHNDGGQDGRVWDLTGFGEGLRNTIALEGRASTDHGFLHWSANFDELQDFEKQIRDLAGGTGLMADTFYNAGTRNQALGDAKAGISQDLDDLAAYVASLDAFAVSPYRNNDGSLTTQGQAGEAVFNAQCIACHSGSRLTNSLDGSTLTDIGTINTLSGNRLGQALTGIDVPTLKDVWATAPYFHNGSALTLSGAVSAHNNLSLSATDLANVVKYIQEVGSEVPPDVAENIAPTATLSTSYVSPWEDLNAIVDGTEPQNSTDNTGGAYGNWRGFSHYGNTEWVQFDWGTAQTIDAFEVYWWTSSLGVDQPTTAILEYLNANDEWVSLGDVGLVLDQFNRKDFNPVVTRSLRLSMSSGKATGIVEAKVWRSVGGGTPSNTPPTISFTSPVNNSVYQVGQIITLVTDAADADGSIARVDFFAGELVVGTAFEAPFSMSRGDAPPGTYTLIAVATDNQGAQTQSEPLRLTVTDGSSNQLPDVAITAPSSPANYTVGQLITITATASDTDGTIARVEFYANGDLFVGDDATAPYQLNRDDAPPGTYEVTAKAIDNEGAERFSTPITVIVSP